MDWFLPPPTSYEFAARVDKLCVVEGHYLHVFGVEIVATTMPYSWKNRASKYDPGPIPFSLT